MAFHANLGIFACDLVSRGAPRGWVASAPVAERFFSLKLQLVESCDFARFAASSLKQRFHPDC